MKRRRWMRVLALVIATLVVMAALAAFAFFWVRAQRSRADLIIRGRILTFDTSMPEAEAVAARAGRIVAIGTDDNVDEHQGWWTRVIELEDGLVATRGFIVGPGDFLALGAAMATDGADMRQRLQAADRAASARGITSFRDLSATPEAIEQMKRMIDAGTLKTRLWINLQRDALALPADQHDRLALKGYGDHRLSVQLDVGDTVLDRDLVGTLSVGKLADLTVLSAELAGKSVDEIQQSVAYTIVGGEVVYESDVR
jgi:predicted amidohydrolase YtcJ